MTCTSIYSSSGVVDGGSGIYYICPSSTGNYTINFCKDGSSSDGYLYFKMYKVYTYPGSSYTVLDSAPSSSSDYSYYRAVSTGVSVSVDLNADDVYALYPADYGCNSTYVTSLGYTTTSLSRIAVVYGSSNMSLYTSCSEDVLSGSVYSRVLGSSSTSVYYFSPSVTGTYTIYIDTSSSSSSGFAGFALYKYFDASNINYTQSDYTVASSSESAAAAYANVTDTTRVKYTLNDLTQGDIYAITFYDVNSSSAFDASYSPTSGSAKITSDDGSSITLYTYGNLESEADTEGNLSNGIYYFEAPVSGSYTVTLRKTSGSVDGDLYFMMYKYYATPSTDAIDYLVSAPSDYTSYSYYRFTSSDNEQLLDLDVNEDDVYALYLVDNTNNADYLTSMGLNEKALITSLTVTEDDDNSVGYMSLYSTYTEDTHAVSNYISTSVTSSSTYPVIYFKASSSGTYEVNLTVSSSSSGYAGIAVYRVYHDTTERNYSISSASYYPYDHTVTLNYSYEGTSSSYVYVKNLTSDTTDTTNNASSSSATITLSSFNKPNGFPRHSAAYYKMQWQQRPYHAAVCTSFCYARKQLYLLWK